MGASCGLRFGSRNSVLAGVQSGGRGGATERSSVSPKLSFHQNVQSRGLTRTALRLLLLAGVVLVSTLKHSLLVEGAALQHPQGPRHQFHTRALGGNRSKPKTPHDTTRLRWLPAREATVTLQSLESLSSDAFTHHCSIR